MLGIFLRRLGLGVYRPTGVISSSGPPPTGGLTIYGVDATIQGQSITIQGV